jgi:putative restriction endonuclease
MKVYVGVTDSEWFRYLSLRLNTDEVNFWLPSPLNLMTQLHPGDLFLFKLKHPRNVIAGGGYFARSIVMPVSYAWKAFEDKNGAPTLERLRANILRLRQRAQVEWSDFQIGCILLAQPFFFSEKDWFPVPSSWASNIVRGRYYDTGEPDGKYLWDEVRFRLAGMQQERTLVEEVRDEDPKRRWIIMRPGQGIFRSAVAAAYGWKCSVTGEKVLPALEAAHIKPFADQGPNVVQNGLLLRADIHKLLDDGYVTVSPDYHFKVSRKVREDYENGRDYYALHDQQLRLPKHPVERPSQDFIAWHNRERFRA